MVMKSKILKTAFLEIKTRKKIFLSLLFMSLLGVGFFAGIKATSPDMKKTIESYYDEFNMMDIELTSYTMFDEKEFEKYSQIKGIDDVEGLISYDAVAKYRSKNPVVKIYSMTDKINKLNLIDGRLPTSSNECVIDEHILKNSEGFSIGEYIEIDNSLNMLKDEKLKIVGVVNSPVYTSSLRGTTNLASGTIDYFLYIPKDNFNTENKYTSLYITTNTNNETYKEEYFDDISKIIEEIKKKDTESYITRRTDNPSYISFIQDTERIDNIAKIFPIIFFIVAVLISLTSMTRMVEEQRVEIGTLKALGYSKISISMKYILYASVATVIGGILGIIIGVNLIPKVIYIMYSMMYKIDDLIIGYNLINSIAGLVISYVCIIGATVFAIGKELKNNPASLMRPKAPKSGKRVFLEKIPFIWQNLSFTNKVTVRNIFRYKKRFLMTIIGIGGCTALIFAGFALKYSVSGLLPSQYQDIFLYDMEVITSNGLGPDEIAKIENNENITSYKKILHHSIKIKNDSLINDDAHIITFDDSEIDNFISLNDYQTKSKLSLEDDVVITEKLSKLLNINVGDEILLIDNENKEYKVIVTKIAENYLYHYIYLSRKTYDEIFDKEPVMNAALINTNYEEEKDQKKIAEDLLKSSGIAQAVVTKTTAGLMDDTMENMNYVVLVLIVSAGILAFSVLYNLSNVNISERIRELATIKVLGFYDREVHNYIEKETTILTVIGICLGLVMGYFLSIIVIETCELDVMMFPLNFPISCYIYSVVITVLFTMIISIFSYFNLKKINMIESLKSVE